MTRLIDSSRVSPSDDFIRCRRAKPINNDKIYKPSKTDANHHDIVACQKDFDAPKMIYRHLRLMLGFETAPTAVKRDFYPESLIHKTLLQLLNFDIGHLKGSN